MNAPQQPPSSQVRSGAPGSPADRLTREPEAFDFFQAVRLLEREALLADAAHRRQPVGFDAAPAQEVVRFRVVDSQRFPAAAIAALHRSGDDAGARPVAMTITCLGLTGPMGVLPGHYSQLVIDTVRNRQLALRDFLDLFHHRLASLFYRAWAKYRLPIVFEHARGTAEAREEDPYTACLFALVGLGQSRLRDRLQFDDMTAIYFGGTLAHRPPNAVSLAALVGEFLDEPVEVRQFQGQWLTLQSADQTRMASRERPRGQYAALGINALAGQRVWGVESMFVLRVGPLGYETFRRFMPEGDLLRAVCQLVRLYVGPAFDFALQPVLRAADVPASRLGETAAAPTRLGWNSWLLGQPAARDADSAVFADEGRPDGTTKVRC
ncbi:MAG: type VI secretion system baseplate subunit TssG [Pirellulaceae bacterium]|jgi:type VI secretion system protein ImpH|nr:type VI secretion system baseplate subunit TssG [Pirellulaceae bacterium]